MPRYRLSPYVHSIENHLVPNTTQHGLFHQLSGDVFEPRERVRALLLAAKLVPRISLSEEDLANLAEDGVQLRQLIEKEFLVPEGYDPLTPFVNQYVGRPMQNPALAYGETAEIALVRTSMKQFVFSPKEGEWPKIIEERMPPIVARIFLMADGTTTLQQIFETAETNQGANLLEENGFIEAINFLTIQERQLIKFTARRDDFDDPLKPCNTVPRNLYHSSRWTAQPSKDSKSNVDFHLHGIQDATWEFDCIEPTINHAFRFPSEALGGFDYGARFCLFALRPEVLPSLGKSDQLSVLEVGGGTGTFARSFIEQASRLRASALNGVALSYNILELSPILAQHQKELLSKQGLSVTQFQQDATEFNLPGRKFDLIIANEVVADFPIASVRRAPHDDGAKISGIRGQEWEGDGAFYLQKYGLDDKDAPESFVVNAGVFQFIERAWQHLSPGGAIILSEYGSEHAYPTQAYNLNHEEFSINFRHVESCAAKLGFECKLVTLKDFLEIDDEVLMLNGAAEHIQCLNYVLEKHGISLPYAAISKREFEARLGGLAERIGLVGFSFSALRANFHYGPNPHNFMVLIMKKPE